MRVNPYATPYGLVLIYTIEIHQLLNANVVIGHRSFCRWQHRHCIIYICIYEYITLRICLFTFDPPKPLLIYRLRNLSFSSTESVQLVAHLIITSCPFQLIVVEHHKRHEAVGYQDSLECVRLQRSSFINHPL